MKTVVLILACLYGCRKCPEKVPPYTHYPIQGREETLPSGKVLRRPLYKAKMPVSWKALPSQSSLRDTTEPNAVFEITPSLHLTFHTFPSDDLKERIPPAWQVERWQKQDGSPAKITPAHHDGFVGLCFQTANTLAWSFQLDPELYQTLAFLGRTHEESAYFRQMGSDFTIKVSGPPEEIEAHRKEIAFFADNIELFQPIPAKR